MERDYPVGHPAASDYAGEPYTPPRAPFSEDFGPEHPARGGRNTSAIDTPDGRHARSVQESEQNAERTAAAEPERAAAAAPEPSTDTSIKPPQPADQMQPSSDNLTDAERQVIAAMRATKGRQGGGSGSQQ